MSNELSDLAKNYMKKHALASNGQNLTKDEIDQLQKYPDKFPDITNKLD